MKCSVAAWLLIGLSLGVPQFGKGEAAGPGSLDMGRAGSPLGKAAQGPDTASVLAKGSERLGRRGGGGALRLPRESASKVRAEWSGLSTKKDAM
jgi:hypothetical protein